MIALRQDMQTFLVRGDDEEGLLVSELAQAVAEMPNGWIVTSIECGEGEKGDVWAIRLREKKMSEVIGEEKR